MEHYLHRVVGIFPTRAEAGAARDQLIENGLAPEKVRLFESPRDTAGKRLDADSDDVLKEILREGAIGTAVGTAAGAIGTAALAAANITLFVANPLLTTLSMLGWGASLGAIVGGAAGAEREKGDVASLAREALDKGYMVLVAYAVNEDQTVVARKVLGDSMAEPAPEGAVSPERTQRPVAG